MRLAIVSDIHGNLAALEAVQAELERERPDFVLQGGDLALNGPRPAEVVDRVRELGWPGVVGNTDEMLWNPGRRDRLGQTAVKLARQIEIMFDELAPVTCEWLGPERLGWMSSLPLESRQGSLLLLHATPGDLWRAPAPDASEDELAGTYGDLDAGLVVYGHIHQPYVRRVDGLTVANSGSVGLPLDGDRRAGYLLVDDGDASVRRVEYDLERHLHDLTRSEYPNRGWLAEVARAGRVVSPMRTGAD